MSQEMMYSGGGQSPMQTQGDADLAGNQNQSFELGYGTHSNSMVYDTWNIEMKPGEMIGNTNWSMLDESRRSDGAKSDGSETKKKL